MQATVKTLDSIFNTTEEPKTKKPKVKLLREAVVIILAGIFESLDSALGMLERWGPGKQGLPCLCGINEGNSQDDLENRGKKWGAEAGFSLV